jgi:hypothetical protein
VVERDADQRAAVASRPRDVDRRLIARDQALIGVHPLGEDAADLACVAELAGDEGLADVAQEVLVLGVVEGVAAVLEE